MTEDEEVPQTNLLRTSQNQYFTSHPPPETPIKKVEQWVSVILENMEEKETGL